MLGKIWKKILFFVLIIACIFNIITKLVNKSSLERELLSSAQYMQQINNENLVQKIKATK